MNNEVPIFFDKNLEKYTKEGLIESLYNYVEFTSFENILDYPNGSPIKFSGSLHIGTYIPSSLKFNRDKACIYGINHSLPFYVKGICGKCAKKVRLMLEAGGLNTAGHPESAFQYAEFLPSIGFKNIAILSGTNNQKAWTASNARIGDISVMAHGQHGHICMWCGKQWISDFKQNGMWVYGREGEGTCYIFRYN